MKTELWEICEMECLEVQDWGSNKAKVVVWNVPLNRVCSRNSLFWIFLFLFSFLTWLWPLTLLTLAFFWSTWKIGLVLWVALCCDWHYFLLGSYVWYHMVWLVSHRIPSNVSWDLGVTLDQKLTFSESMSNLLLSSASESLQHTPLAYNSNCHCHDGMCIDN